MDSSANAAKMRLEFSWKLGVSSTNDTNAIGEPLVNLSLPAFIMSANISVTVRKFLGPRLSPFDGGLSTIKKGT